MGLGGGFFRLRVLNIILRSYCLSASLSSSFFSVDFVCIYPLFAGLLPGYSKFMFYWLGRVTEI